MLQGRYWRVLPRLIHSGFSIPGRIGLTGGYIRGDWLRSRCSMYWCWSIISIRVNWCGLALFRSHSYGKEGVKIKWLPFLPPPLTWTLFSAASACTAYKSQLASCLATSSASILQKYTMHATAMTSSSWSFLSSMPDLM